MAIFAKNKRVNVEICRNGSKFVEKKLPFCRECPANVGTRREGFPTNFDMVPGKFQVAVDKFRLFFDKFRQISTNFDLEFRQISTNFGKFKPAGIESGLGELDFCVSRPLTSACAPSFLRVRTKYPVVPQFDRGPCTPPHKDNPPAAHSAATLAILRGRDLPDVEAPYGKNHMMN